MRRQVTLLLSCFLLLLSERALSAAETDGSGSSSGEGSPQFKIVDKWRGIWDVKMMRRQPPPAQEVMYAETFDWILDGRFLRGKLAKIGWRPKHVDLLVRHANEDISIPNFRRLGSGR